MKKVFSIFVLLLLSISVVFAYYPSQNDTDLLHKVYKKLDDIHQKSPSKTQVLRVQLSKIKSKYASDERLTYIIDELIRYTEFQKGKIIVKDTTVIDGDTISVIINGIREKIRLIGIDTPELGDEDSEYGEEALEYLEQILEGKDVYIEMDPTQGERDKYERILAFVFHEGSNINLHMIEEGYAFEYTYDKPYKYQDEFRNAEKKASEKGNFIWESYSLEEKMEEEVKTGKYYDPFDESYLDMGFTCNKRKYCSYMSSCDEVKYFFYQCNAKTFDRDNDGIPCENICGSQIR